MFFIAFGAFMVAVTQVPWPEPSNFSEAWQHAIDAVGLGSGIFLVAVGIKYD